MAKTIDLYRDGYIPSDLCAQMWAGTFPDLSTYANAAHAAAGQGGEVKYPAGTMSLANISVYAEQVVRGANTQVKQVGSASCFVDKAWVDNDTAWYEGPSYADFNFSTPNSSVGGYAIVLMTHHSHLLVKSTGLPILLTAKTQNGTTIGSGDTSGHTFMDGCVVNHSPRGAIASDGTKATDIKVAGLIVDDCGAVGGSAAIQALTFAGWQMDRLKMFATAGALLRATSGCQEAVISNSDLDWAGGDTFGIDIASLPASPGLRFIGNNVRITAPSASGGAPYTAFRLHSSGQIFLNHVGNSYAAFASAGSNIVAGTLIGSTISGAKCGNSYNGFSGSQIGNLETALPLV